MLYLFKIKISNALSLYAKLQFLFMKLKNLDIVWQGWDQACSRWNYLEIGTYQNDGKFVFCGPLKRYFDPQVNQTALCFYTDSLQVSVSVNIIIPSQKKVFELEFMALSTKIVGQSDNFSAGCQDTIPLFSDLKKHASAKKDIPKSGMMLLKYIYL